MIKRTLRILWHKWPMLMDGIVVLVTLLAIATIFFPLVLVGAACFVGVLAMLVLWGLDDTASKDRYKTMMKRTAKLEQELGLPVSVPDEYLTTKFTPREVAQQMIAQPGMVTNYEEPYHKPARSFSVETFDTSSYDGTSYYYTKTPISKQARQDPYLTQKIIEDANKHAEVQAKLVRQYSILEGDRPNAKMPDMYCLTCRKSGPVNEHVHSPYKLLDNTDAALMS